MADFDLVQTDAQVQSILNDGQNMQGAGAQATLTTESVLLKDVNGNYHKILKSSFTEAIRDTLAGLLVNNDKGTTINQIAAIASGDFGSITPANLASVLDVGFFSHTPEQSQAINCNNLRESGTYRTYQNANTPTSANDRIGLLIVFRGNDYIVQLFVAKAFSFYVRLSKDEGSSWEAWKEITLTTV